MKYFGTRSLSSRLSMLMKILFFISIAGTVLAAVLFAVMHFKGSGGNLIWQYSFNGLSLSIENPEREYPLLYLMMNFLVAVPLILLCLKLWKLFGNFKKEEIFTEENFRTLQTTGLLIILSGLFMSLNNFINWNYFLSIAEPPMPTHWIFRIDLTAPWRFLTRKADLSGFSLSYTLFSQAGTVFFGAAVLFFSHLFKKAILIKSENDLTI